MRAPPWWLLPASALFPRLRLQDDLTPRQTYDALDALRVNPDEVYTVRDLRLQRDTVSLSLDDGTLGFFADFQGKLTGAVFTGRGRVLAIPRDSGERQSLARFLGVPILDQAITDAYIRFTDNTAQELLDQIQSSHAQKTPDADFVAHWNRNAASLNSSHSLRILMDLLSDRPIPYFFANLWSPSYGMFDVWWTIAIHGADPGRPIALVGGNALLRHLDLILPRGCPAAS